MKFQTSYNKKPFAGEKMDPTSKVETAGYVSSEKRINGMMQCGQQIRKVAPESYDYQFEPDDFEADPTRKTGFDMTDAAMLSKQIIGRAFKPSQTAPDASESTETEKKDSNQPPK